MKKNILLAHLDSAKVKVGEVLKSGKNIGIMGNTGESTGVHLHTSGIIEGDNVTVTDFYRGNGSQSDPRPYLRKYDNSNWFCEDAVMSLDWQATEAPYSTSKKHLGVDTAFSPSKKGKINNNKDTNKITKIGFDIYFGNYVILELNHTKSSTPPPSTNKTKPFNQAFKPANGKWYNVSHWGDKSPLNIPVKDLKNDILTADWNGWLKGTQFRNKQKEAPSEFFTLRRGSDKFTFKTSDKNKFSVNNTTYTVLENVYDIDDKKQPWIPKTTFQKS